MSLVRNSSCERGGSGLSGTTRLRLRDASGAGGGNLQAALDSAAPGDVIELPAGATFLGNFVLPQKNGTAPITIRTAPSDALPKANERISPDYSGKLARIQSAKRQRRPENRARARHWKLVLLKFGPNQGGAGDIILLGDGSTAKSNLDRVPSDPSSIAATSTAIPCAGRSAASR